MSEQKKILNYNTLPEMFFKQAKENSFKPLLWFKKNNNSKLFMILYFVYCNLFFRRITLILPFNPRSPILLQN